MKLIKALPFVILLIVFAAAASAQLDPAPTVSITSSPGTTVTNSATIRVSARDSGASAGISHIDFYVNGNLDTTKQCGFATSCILSRIRSATAPKNESYYAIVHDMSQSIQSNTLFVIFLGPNTPPNVTLPNRSINEDSGNNTNLTDLWAYVTDAWTNSSSLIYTLTGQTNTTVANCVITNNRWVDCNTPTLDAYGTSTITISASDEQLTGTGNFTLTVLPVNDAPIFNTGATIPAITFAEDTTYTVNISDYFSDVDNTKTQLTFTPASIGNITIQYTIANGKVRATLTPAANWNGVVTTSFTASDGALSSGASNTVTITVTPVNDRPCFAEDSSVHELDYQYVYKDIFFSYRINASDIDVGDILTYYDNTTLFNIDLNTGWINFTANSTGNYSVLLEACDDSGAANNCTNYTWDFEIWEHPPILFDNIYVNPASPITYSENRSYILFHVDLLMEESTSGPQITYDIDESWLELIRSGYAQNISGNNIPVYGLAAGNYTFRWNGNLTCGLQYSTSWYNYTILRANPGLTLNIPLAWTYGMPANVSCTANTTQVTPVLTRNGTIVSNPDTTLLGAGTYLYVCSVPQTQNYTGANSTGILTISPAVVTTQLTVITPITYGTAANVTCNASPAAITPTLTRNGAALPGLTDTSVLGAGNYTYSCYYTATQNYTGSNTTQTMAVNPVQTIINVLLNGTNGNINAPANSMVIINATINVPNATMNWFLNSTYIGTIPPAWLFGPVIPGAYNITATYAGSQNYTAATATQWIFVAMPPMKMNFNPASGSTINTSFTLSFATTYNTGCRWSLTDQAYTAMTNAFTTTGQMAHSGTVSGLNLGTDNVHVACTGDTAINNTDLTYFVQNIIEQGSALTNGATANNSILYSTSVNNSTLQSVNATGSTIRGSILTNCVVINSTVKNYRGTNCRIVNSYVDPPNPGSDLTGSTITGNSRIMISNVTYSTVTSSNITNSNVNNSAITNSEITNSNVISCAITNSQLQGGVICNNSTITNTALYNVTVTNAIINNGIMTSGTLIYNGTNYTAPPNVNIASIVNLPPTAAFTYTPASPKRNQNINFNAGSSSDPNPGDTLAYSWNFGDGSANATGTTTGHAYTATGTYNVTLTATDSFGLQDTLVRQVAVTASTTPKSPGGGGGGGGGGGSAFYARTWQIDLDARSPEIRTFNRVDKAVITVNNATYTMRMLGVDREHTNFTLQDIPYSLINYEIKKFDFNNDGMSEMRMIILNNYYTRAQIRFDKFVGPMQVTTPFAFSNLTWGLGENETQEIIVPEAEPEEQEPAAEPETPPAEEKEVTSWLDKIPKDSRTIGLGITAAVVIAGLIIYFLISSILL